MPGKFCKSKYCIQQPPKAQIYKIETIYSTDSLASRLVSLFQFLMSYYGRSHSFIFLLHSIGINCSEGISILFPCIECRDAETHASAAIHIGKYSEHALHTRPNEMEREKKCQDSCFALVIRVSIRVTLVSNFERHTTRECVRIAC